MHLNQKIRRFTALVHETQNPRIWQLFIICLAWRRRPLSLFCVTEYNKLKIEPQKRTATLSDERDGWMDECYLLT